MSKPLLIFGAITGLLAVECRTGQAAESLCAAQQEIFMTCKTANGKLISVCGSKDSAGKLVSLQYMFGYKRKVEMIYPEHKVDNLARFSFFYDGNAKSSDNILIFSSNKFRYYVYDRRGAFEGNYEGVDVVKGTETVAHIPCANRGPVHYGLDQLNRSPIGRASYVPESEQ